MLDARRLSPHHRPAEGDHQPRRREDLAARGRRGADGPPGRRRRSSPSRMPHDKLGEEVAAAVVLREGQHGERARAARLRGRAGSPTSRCRASVRLPGRDPQGRHRQAAAHRPGRAPRPQLAHPTAPRTPAGLYGAADTGRRSAGGPLVAGSPARAGRHPRPFSRLGRGLHAGLPPGFPDR